MSLFGQASGNTLKGKINRLTELKGYSAYEVAVINGYNGTEEDWLNDIYALSKSWAVGSTGMREGEDTNNSKYYSEQAAVSKAAAAASESAAKASEATVENAKAVALAAQSLAEIARNEAETAKSSAQSSANTATAKASEAANSANQANESKNAAATSAASAAESAESAESAAGSAAAQVENRLADYVDDAEAAKSGAEAAQRAAEKARDEAQSVAGGDYMTPAVYDPKGKAQDVFAYAEDKAAVVQTNLNTHDGNTTKHITAEERTAWNAKSNFSGSYNDLTDKPTIPTVPTKVSAFENDKGYITGYTETDPTVPAWAKAASKPSYTASEVGAAPSSHTSDTTVHITASERTAWNSKAAASDLTSHTGNTTVHITAAERTAWNGKAAGTHTHTKSQITDFPSTMTPSAHNQAASTITAGTFAGQVVANSDGEYYGSFLLRNTCLSSYDLNPTTNGEICWTYG